MIFQAADESSRLFIIIVFIAVAAGFIRRGINLGDNFEGLTAALQSRREQESINKFGLNNAPRPISI